MKKLNNDDRRVVDLLLDKSRTDGRNGKMFIKPAEISPQKVAQAEKALSLLDHMSVEDPPADLVMKTLRRIDQIASQMQPIQEPAKVADLSGPLQ